MEFKNIINTNTVEELEKEELTPKQKFRALAKIFHPDTGGDSDITRELYAAYRNANNGDTSDLDRLYDEWLNPDSERKVKIEDLLSEKSDWFFGEWKKNRKQNFPLEYIQLTSYYLDLCRERGLKPDIDFIFKFISDQGWLPDNINRSYFEKRIK